jgi:prepilin-type N-terminal cleavage/methylation domain-containing protein
MSGRSDTRRQRARRRLARRGMTGFTLIEVLVSLAIAMLFLTTLMQAFGSIRLQAAAPGELAGAATLARSLLAEARTKKLSPDDSRDGTSGAYRWRMTVTPVELADPPPPDIRARPATPAPADAPEASQKTNAASPSTSDATGPQHAQAPLPLFRVAVEVVTPSGRHDRLEGLVVPPPPPVRQTK